MRTVLVSAQPTKRCPKGCAFLFCADSAQNKNTFSLCDSNVISQKIIQYLYFNLSNFYQA